MAKTGNKYSRKKVIVFAFEGKNNKTEKLYFSHFKPSDDNYILKSFSSGVTDIRNMIKSVKGKRAEYDYHATEDLTYIFVDGDNDSTKLSLISTIKAKLPKDIHLIVSNPTFEVWFLNHFANTTKQMNNEEIIKELKKHINNYQKNEDYYNLLEINTNIAIHNSNNQLSLNIDNPFTDVVKLLANNIIKKK